RPQRQPPGGEPQAHVPDRRVVNRTGLHRHAAQLEDGLRLPHQHHYKYVTSEISAEIKNRVTTDHCTPRAIALGTSVIVSATLNPSVEQITPASRPGRRDLETTSNTSHGP